jgi:membrane-bound serine protease (ClpP class)
MNNITLLITLLASGALLIGAEIFVPGAVLGALGGVSLFAAVIVAFGISSTCGFYTLFGVLILTVLTVAVWIKFFPRSGIGRKMTLSLDGSNFKSSASRQSLLGQVGTTVSQLRPAGYALIDGKRRDVVTEGGIVEPNQPVKVVKVEGNRIVVRKVDA